MEMFRKVIDPTGPGEAAEIAITECRKRMSISKWIIVTLIVILIAGLVGLRIAPDMIGATGKRLFGAVAAVILVLGVDWIVEYQRLQRILRLSKS